MTGPVASLHSGPAAELVWREDGARVFVAEDIESHRQLKINGPTAVINFYLRRSRATTTSHIIFEHESRVLQIAWEATSKNPVPI